MNDIREFNDYLLRENEEKSKEITYLLQKLEEKNEYEVTYNNKL